MKHLTKIILLFLFYNSIYSQTKSNVGCEISNPPVLRGFHMGQTVEDINKFIPNFQSIYNKQQERENRPEFLSTESEAGFILITDVDAFYPRPGERVVHNKDFEDVGFYWHFLDGKLFRIFVKYEVFEPKSLKDFVNQVSEKTNLPTQNWVIKDRDHASLKCVGFNVEIWTGKYASKPDYLDSPTVTITDTASEIELNKRERAIELRKKNEERERRRKEREKKTVFRP